MQTEAKTELIENGRELLGRVLNRVLADEFALSAATRDYHWNVTGPRFRSLHELFDEQYRELDRWIEGIGESVRALGITARADWGELTKTSRLEAAPGAGLAAQSMLTGLAALHVTMVERLQADIAACINEGSDSNTGELLAGLIEYHETTAWMLSELLDDRDRAEA